MVALSSYNILPALHIAVHATLMQVYSHMFRICQTGNKEIRTPERNVSGTEAAAALPSVGRKRL